MVVRPDGIHKENITIRQPLLNNTNVSAFLRVHWLTKDIGPNVYYNMGLASYNTQFNTFNNLYKKYYVYAIVIKYIPNVYG